MTGRQSKVSESGKHPSPALELAREACHAARLKKEAATRELDGLGPKISALTNARNLVKSQLEELQAMRRVHEIAGEEFDLENLKQVEAQFEQAEKELAELKNAPAGYAKALDILRDRLFEKRDELCKAIEKDAAGLRARALQLHSQGTQALRDAFAIVDALDDGYFQLNVPSIDGCPGNIMHGLDVSPDIAERIEELRPHLYERNISLRRVLR